MIWTATIYDFRRVHRALMAVVDLIWPGRCAVFVTRRHQIWATRFGIGLLKKFAEQIALRNRSYANQIQYQNGLHRRLWPADVRCVVRSKWSINMGSQSSKPVNYPRLNAEYRWQLHAIRSLLANLEQTENERTERISELERYASPGCAEPDEFVMDQRDFLVYFSNFQDAAHSMAAISMLAPLLEAVFRDFCSKINRPVPGNLRSEGGIADYVSRVVREEKGVSPHFPEDLRPTLKAMFTYRNKMFHCGFEWPKPEIESFDKVRKTWGDGWFEHSSFGGDPWMFYMSRAFVSHCVEAVDRIITGLDDFLNEKAELQLE